MADVLPLPKARVPVVKFVFPATKTKVGWGCECCHLSMTAGCVGAFLGLLRLAQSRLPLSAQLPP